ncbi:hypothetical protein QYF36_003983 [Acer negundo]|nr:hypothetical protein QYF36_003983 [Acer negundo]
MFDTMSAFPVKLTSRCSKEDRTVNREVPEMAEEDFSVVEDKLEIVGGGESGVHEADQQQRHAISAVEYVNSYV